MHTPTATETLAEARAARARGDVDSCLQLSVLAMDKANEERAHDVAFLAACTPGRMFVNRGEREAAAGWYQRALEIALDFGLTRRLPEAYHDLYAVNRDGPDAEVSRRYFATSAELYLDTNQRHPRITALYADRAEGLFMREPSLDTAADAHRLWKSVPATLTEQAECFLSACSMMVSSAWMRDGNSYNRGVRLMLHEFPRLTCYEGTSLSLSHAATGAIKAGDYPGAASIAQEALRVAVARGECVAEDRAREVLSAALGERESGAHLLM